MDVHSFVPVSAIRAAAAAPEPGVGVLAGLLTLLMAFWNLHIVVLVILVAIAGGMDLLVGARRAHLRERDGEDVFSKEKLDDGLFGKVIYLVVSFFLGMCVDLSAAVIGDLGNFGFVAPFETYTPITAVTLFYRFTREIASVLRNVEETPGGKDAVWPALTKVIDTLRYRMTTPGAEGSHPGRRWDDELSAEERRYLQDRLAERRKDGAAAPQVAP